jgi:diaminopimelate epimerase
MIKFGSKVRSAEEFKPEGINVNVIYFKNGKYFIRTYERGVEDETLSCGTGVVASAVALNITKKISSPISFNTFGNDILIVDFMVKNQQISEITLTGPAKINYIGNYNF